MLGIVLTEDPQSLLDGSEESLAFAVEIADVEPRQLVAKVMMPILAGMAVCFVVINFITG